MAIGVATIWTYHVRTRPNRGWPIPAMPQWIRRTRIAQKGESLERGIYRSAVRTITEMPVMKVYGGEPFPCADARDIRWTRV
jgi:hypothetical protein